MAKYPSDDLRVYTVWLTLPMGGIRELWDSSVMPDTRVRHYWDTAGVSGQWFAREVDGYNGLAWDVYYLYGPDAEWDSIPARPERYIRGIPPRCPRRHRRPD